MAREKKVLDPQLLEARKKLNRVGLTLLVYYAIMAVLASLAIVVELMIFMVRHITEFGVPEISAMYDLMTEHLRVATLTNAWGYILAILLGTGILLLWKKPRYFKETLFRREKKMTFAVFVQLTCILMGVQLVSGLIQQGLEWVLNQMGLSTMKIMELVSSSSSSVSMFLYAGFLGPIAEELLFRGVLLRSAESYGKRFAIFFSALMFGMFHGNLVQSPFAMLVGFVWGYMAIEYSILWAIVLHIFNNFVMVDLLSRLRNALPTAVGSALELGILVAFTVGAIVTLIVKRKEVKSFFAENPYNPMPIRAMMKAPTILIFLILMILSSLGTITPM